MHIYQRCHLIRIQQKIIVFFSMTKEAIKYLSIPKAERRLLESELFRWCALSLTVTENFSLSVDSPRCSCSGIYKAFFITSNLHLFTIFASIKIQVRCQDPLRTVTVNILRLALIST